MRRAAQANWSRLPNHNPPRFYTAWTRSGHAEVLSQSPQRATVLLANFPTTKGRQARDLAAAQLCIH